MEKVSILIGKMKNRELDEILLKVYQEKTLLNYERERFISALEKFEELYGDLEVSIYTAPGRTEVGGNHTDHQHGNVLAAAVHLDVIGVVAKTDTNTVSIVSDSYVLDDISIASLDHVEKEGSSEALVQGVLFKMEQLGVPITGFRAFFTSDVLIGSGLSSSAAFENIIGSIAVGLARDYNLESLERLVKIDNVTIAKVSQFAEKEFFGKPCGLMDQMASSVGNLVQINFYDNENPTINKVDVDFESFGYSLCIVDTKGSHANLTDDYAAIPAEMKSVAAYFGKNYLVDVNEEDFYENLQAIREQFGDRAVLRSFHYFEDSKRALAQANALNNRDINEFLRLIQESGDSSFKYLQNIYSTKNIKEQGVAIALGLCDKFLSNNKGVARVHGGGFAGTIQCFVKSEYVQEFVSKMNQVLGDEVCHVLYIRQMGAGKIM